MEGRHYASLSEAPPLQSARDTGATREDHTGATETGRTRLEQRPLARAVEHDYDRQYLLNQFPDYDYRAPNEPWKMDYRVPENRIYVSHQMQAFHYWWALNQTVRSGAIGYAIMTPHLPFMFHLPSLMHIFHNEYNFQDCRIIVCSAALPQLVCLSGKPKCTEADCLVPFLSRCIELLTVGGVLVGFILDEAQANAMGASFLSVRRQSGETGSELGAKTGMQFKHIWSTQNFLKILKEFLVREPTVQLEEFDTLRNYFACNFVLRKH
jgi:hypothetical protein